MNAKTRAELKQYFVSNAIPTQDNFAALIDAQINQADDGVFKEINQPLGIVAATGEQRRVLQLYSEHPADNPAWLVSLRPKDPANPSNFVAGLGIADGAGNTRLLLDAAGNLKVVGRFHVQGRYSAPLAKDNNDRPGIAITGDYPQLDLFSGVNNSNHGATIRLGAFNDGSKTTFKHWVIGTAGRNASFLDIGYSPNNDPNPHAGIRNYYGKTVLTLEENGNVGIGTTAPQSALHVHGNAGLLTLEGSDHTYIQWYPLTMAAGRKGWIGYGNANDMTMSVNNEAGILQLNGHSVVVGSMLTVSNGALLGEIGLGTQKHGTVPSPFETIQMHPSHNLRICFGTRERFLLANSGDFYIYFNQGYWRFQNDGNLVKYRSDGTVLWALGRTGVVAGW